MCQLVGGDRAADLTRIYQLSTKILVVAVGSAAVVLCSFPGEALFGWTGDLATVRNASAVLVALVIGTALNGLMHMPLALQMAHGWTRLLFATNAVGVLVMIPVTYLLGRRFGPAGVASAWALLNAGYVTVVVPLMHRRILVGQAPRWYGESVVVPLLGALAGALLVRWLAPAAPTGRFESVAVLASAAVAALLGASLLTGDVRRLLVARLRSVAAARRPGSAGGEA
jgi:O-antigen/teichoic acid export membrane protein